MYISSRQKATILAVLLVVGGGGAFVYIDPLELDLLGLNQVATIPAVATKVQPRAAVSVKAAPEVIAPSTAPMAAASKTPATSVSAVVQAAPAVPAPATVAQATKAAPLVEPPPVPTTPPVLAAKTAPNAVPTIFPAAPVVAKPMQSVQPHLKMSKSLKGETLKPAYPPSVDLRHCLDQPNPQEIAKCAGE